MDKTLKASIDRLVKLSLYLFILTNIAIFGTLLIHNVFTHSKFTYNYFPFDSQNLDDYECNVDNNFCRDFLKIKSETLDQCPVNKIKKTYNVDNVKFQQDITGFKKYLFKSNLEIKSEFKNSEIFITFNNLDIKNEKCIKNYPLTYSLYKVFPLIPNLIANIKLKPDYFDVTGIKINPFLYGETSISNLAKRYPLYLIFKPFLFIASIVMILYWTYIKKIILNFDKNQKNHSFYYLGILSGVFLFFHVLFLGSEIDNEIFKIFRKFIIIFFILFELLAQFFLIKKFISIKNLIGKYINDIYLKIKWFFVLFFLIITAFMIGISLIYSLPKEIENIIEWNYFVILSFYYLLTFYLWKRN